MFLLNNNFFNLIQQRVSFTKSKIAQMWNVITMMIYHIFVEINYNMFLFIHSTIFQFSL